jgi:Domain of unknown function (DUF4279)
MAEPSDPWSSASISVRSTSCTPEVLTERLGLQPAFNHRLGEPVSRRRPDGPKRQWHSWSLSSPLPEDAPLQLRVVALLDLLSERREVVLSLRPDCEVELLLGLTAAPLGRLHDIDAASIALMADLGISLRIDLYESDITAGEDDE